MRAELYERNKNVASAIDDYDQAIKNKTSDVNAFYKSMQAGIIFNNVTYSPKYISGGAFSLDGINLNAKGNALVANECIKAINLKFGSQIPLADVNSYKGIIFP